MDYILPFVVCTCGRPLSCKWLTYLEKVKQFRKEDGRSENDELLYLTNATTVTAEGRAMTAIGLTQECCRVKFLTHPGN
jgi:DNA-directed RNA polymerase subunit N (RpoN/RPB10)